MRCRAYVVFIENRPESDDPNNAYDNPSFNLTGISKLKFRGEVLFLIPSLRSALPSCVRTETNDFKDEPGRGEYSQSLVSFAAAELDGMSMACLQYWSRRPLIRFGKGLPTERPSHPASFTSSGRPGSGFSLPPATRLLWLRLACD